MSNYLLVLVIAFVMSGCASIISDSTYPVTINSSPNGAEFEIKDEDGMIVHKGRTPAMVTLSASSGYFDCADYTIIFKKKGYEPQMTTLSCKLDGWYIGNILFGGLIGFLIIDPATGAMWKLPKIVSVSLYEKQARIINYKGIYVMSIDDVPEEYKSQLIRIN
ncbi:hypothetical protein [Methylomarinovum caldicuralii]|uniref:hypothetical protein n=1 Tax=Methylomarinovum caldicuralii TaxID=438856 RepID=UPI0029553748|nr:hypothetical protein [Methylomarinovum caldicuralii]